MVTAGGDCRHGSTFAPAQRDLNLPETNIARAFMIAIIALDAAMILSADADPGGGIFGKDSVADSRIWPPGNRAAV